MKLKRSFYLEPTLKVAKDLLGKFLVHKIGKGKIVGKITETEAYVGPKDLASHASKGKTKRTVLMFGKGGFAYVYLIYGMYYCFNVVTEREGYPAAVLIRALDPKIVSETLASIRRSGPASRFRIQTNGPGKVCNFMKIDKRLNGIDLTGDVLWIEDRGVKVNKSEIISAPRVGIDYAGHYKDKLWRFFIRKKQNQNE